eukprot:12248172-Karenia_brevis.AAC.1
MEGVHAKAPGGDSDGHGSLQAVESAISTWYPSSAGGLSAQAQADRNPIGLSKSRSRDPARASGVKKRCSEF